MKERSVLMKKVFLLLVCVGLLLSSPLVYAQTTKIGYVDLQRIMRESKRAIKEREAVQKRADELTKEISKKQEELKALKESLEKKASMLSEQARRDQEKEYQQKAREYEWLVKDSREEMKSKEQEVVTKLLKSINTVVNKLGEEGNYTLILEASVVAYASDGLDITDQVIKAFDAAKE
jgi:outer membrane protein